MKSKASYVLLMPRPDPSLLSLVIPLYNEEAVIPFLRSALDEFLQELPGGVEIILANDGSAD